MANSNVETEMRNVYALGFVSFFTDVSTEMVLSLLPVFILDLPGSSRVLLGLIEGAAEALSYGLRAVSGIFSDRFRRRKVLVLAGYALSTAVKPLFAVAHTAMEAFVIRVSDRVGKGVRTAPRDALISESVGSDRRGAAFGLHRTLDQLGAIVGPVLASTVIVVLGWTVRDVFWLSFVPGAMSLLIILLFVRERAGLAERTYRFMSGMRTVMTRRYAVLLLLVGIFSVGAFNVSFVLLNAAELGVGTALIPLVYAVVNVTHTAIAIPAGVLSDRIGRERVLLLGYAGFLGTALIMIVTPTHVSSSFLIGAVYGVYVGIVETVQRALVPSYAPSGLRGTAYGVYYLVVGTAFFAANVIVGSLWQHAGAATAVTYSVATTSIAIVGLFLFLRNLKRRDPE